MAEIKSLPTQAFDGQIFIDAFRVKWEFDGSSQCWRKIGQSPDIPVVSEAQTGLLSARLKQLLDGIPDHGGHFGIITQPLLSLVPQNPEIVHKDQISKVIGTKSGTSIKGKAADTRAYAVEQFVGKILMFKTGILTKKAFLIFTNDQDTIYIEGDATEAAVDDKFEILDASNFNPSGILLGDIMLVSDTIDITCVDGEGLPLAGGQNCNVDVIYCDNVSNPPGLNFQLNSNFLDTLCVIVPGCQGPKGDRGDKGDPGADGTGDGPQGETGDPGVDAPTVANTFAGIKIIDIDDIYDTAVVSMELDPANGKLNVVRAKVKTPDSSTPATQLVATPINRSIRFKNDETFEYELMKPTVDAIDELDVDVLKYPQQYTKPAGLTQVQTTSVNKVKLSQILAAVFSYYEDRLAEINDTYNKQLKTYIEEKDAGARTILANLAQEVAECEFELPIDFCLGITPSDCKEEFSENSEEFEFPLSSLIMSFPTDTETSVMASSTGIYDVPAFGIPVDPPTFVQPGEEIPFIDIGQEPATLIDPNTTQLTTTDVFIPIQYPDNTSASASQVLPAGTYVIKINGGAATSNMTQGYVVGTGEISSGLQVVSQSGNNPPEVKPALAPSVGHNAFEKNSVVAAYKASEFQNQIVAVELTEPGRINLTMPMQGKNVQGGISAEVFKLNTPPGAQLLV